MSGIRFQVLGPLSVVDGERDATPRPAKLRTLLALLLVHAPGTVSLDTLVDELWGDEPPATASTALQVYVSQLRQLLDPGRPARDPAQLLQTARPGYRLRLEPSAATLTASARSPSAARPAWPAGTRPQRSVRWEPPSSCGGGPRCST